MSIHVASKITRLNQFRASSLANVAAARRVTIVGKIVSMFFSISETFMVCIKIRTMSHEYGCQNCRFEPVKVKFNLKVKCSGTKKVN